MDLKTHSVEDVVAAATGIIDMDAPSGDSLFALSRTSQVLHWSPHHGQTVLLDQRTLDSLSALAGVSATGFSGLSAIAATDSGIFAVGDEALVLGYVGERWRLLPSPFEPTIEPTGTAPPKLWDLSYRMGVLRVVSIDVVSAFEKGAWEHVSAPGSCLMLSIASSELGDVAGGGAPPCILRMHGDSMALVPLDGLPTGLFTDAAADQIGSRLVFWDEGGSIEGGSYVVVAVDEVTAFNTPLSRLEGVALLGPLTFLLESRPDFSRLYARG